MALHASIYSLFPSLGDKLAGAWKELYEDIKASGIKVYPPAYAATGFFISLIVGVISLLFSSIFLLFTSFLPEPILQIIRLSLPWPLHLLIPILAPLSLSFLVFVLYMSYPKLKKISRGSNMEAEMPYLAAYIATMATGGVSPYISMERLANAPRILFNIVKEEAAKFYLRVKAMGYDPLTAIEESAKEVPNKGYRQLMLGYAATLRAGGDIVHYLQRQTEMMLRERVSQVKIIGERVGMLLEGYLAITLVTALTIYVMFTINYSMAQVGLGLGGSEFQLFLFGYILMPFISGLFIYLADLLQPKYPVYDKTPYYVFFGASLPLTLLLLFTMTMPFLAPDIFGNMPSPFKQIVKNLCSYLNLPSGFESGVGITLALMIGLIPAVLADFYSSLKNEGIQYGITRFLRDLVEVRKTGMSPEKCIMSLRSRDYGKFSKYLREMSNQVGWGVPLSKIFEDFAKKVKNWLALISMYLLVESIEVGGGTPEILESLANYAETLEQVEKEKRAALKPLLLIPYIGAIILVVVVLILIGFMNYIMSMAGGAIGPSLLVSTLTPPIVLDVYTMGLVAGKVGSERVSAGFKHSMFLMIITLVSMALTPHLVSGLAIKL
ncbi:MAG: hypothetical protein DRJ55_03560 [Thermoprotei archaeon]|nr:MAG: hypothetical protein DRJ55_03560 [Thermoprotei archaeon]